jgi:phosphate transport system substrate-binding protein
MWSIRLQAQQTMTLVGSGGSLASPLFAMWGKDFNRLHPAVQVAYVHTSSRDGIEQINLLHEDFAFGEVPLTNKHRNNTNPLLEQVPLAVVSIVPIYNLPGRDDIRFTGELLAQIYMGHISNWNDERIAKLNPGVVFPNLPITPVQRPEGTGSRYIFTNFMAKASPEFRRWVKNARHEMPGEVVAERSPRMVEKVTSTPGAIGFVEWGYVLQFRLQSARVQNSSGKFVKASIASISAASTAMQDLVFTNSPGPLLDAPGENSYALTSYAWVFLPLTGMASERTDNLYQFLYWCLGEGQGLIEGHGYNRLPKPVAIRAQAKLQTLLR